MELKVAIFNWLVENENAFNRFNNCVKHFNKYIYTDTGEFDILADGENTFIYIQQIENALFRII